MQVDLAKELFDIQVGGDLAVGHHGGKRMQRLPEQARACAFLRAGDRRDCRSHVVRLRAARGIVVGLQVRQQGFFEVRAAGRDVDLAHGSASGRQLGQHRQIEWQQVGRMDLGLTLAFDHVAVIREQARRLLRGAAQEFVEVFAQRTEGVQHHLHALGVAGQLTILETIEHRFGGGGEHANAFDIDHLQGAVRLVQMRFCMQQQRWLRLGRAASGVAQGRRGAREGVADFANDPGQRAGIKTAGAVQGRHRPVRIPRGSGTPNPSIPAPAWPVPEWTARSGGYPGGSVRSRPGSAASCRPRRWPWWPGVRWRSTCR